ncbi:MAG TPA: M23 family metallopeptidase [Candidatus Cloacimonetes bacterium]|nr:M23 family metallopeptidase [Candidatus Cloacimonadota bacterium]
MRLKVAVLIKVLVITLLVVIVVIDSFIIKYLRKKIDNITIVTFESDTLIALSPKSIKENLIVFTPQFVDDSANLKSPFNDGLSLKELIKKYIRNSWADHYGTLRGTKKRRRIHEGIDLYVPENTPVFPLAKYGIVTEVSDNPHYMVQVECKKQNGEIDSVKVEYGKVVRILYPEGIESVYAHLNEVNVSLGQVVNGNTKVGLTGLTGNIRNSGKPSHLHLELRDSKNRSFDPRHRLHYDYVCYEHFLNYLDISD